MLLLPQYNDDQAALFKRAMDVLSIIGLPEDLVWADPLAN